MPGKNWCEREALTWFSRFRIQNSSPSVNTLSFFTRYFTELLNCKIEPCPVLSLHCCKSHTANRVYHPGTAPRAQPGACSHWTSEPALTEPHSSGTASDKNNTQIAKEWRNDCSGTKTERLQRKICFHFLEAAFSGNGIFCILPENDYRSVLSIWRLWYLHPSCVIWKALFRCTYHANWVLCLRPQGTSRIMPMTANVRCPKCELCSSELHRYLHKLSKPSAKHIELSCVWTTKTALGLISFSAVITFWVGTREICS